LLWYQNERDGFVCLPDGRVLVGVSLDVLTAEAAGLAITLEREEPTEYDFDRIQAWSQRPSAEGIECPVFLDAWNFFDDLGNLYAAPDSEYARLSWAAAGCYDKLFWGSNLPSVTPPGEQFIPSWSQEELAAIAQVFQAGLARLAEELAGAKQRAGPEEHIQWVSDPLQGQGRA
jgi:hypothetical protein